LGNLYGKLSKVSSSSYRQAMSESELMLSGLELPCYGRWDLVPAPIWSI
jgi:hypothetical protein